MRRHFLFAPAVVALTAILPRGSGAADVAPIHLEALVPAKCLGFASIEEIGTLGARFRATALGKMFDDPEMKGFLAPVKEDLEKLAKEKQAKGGLPIPPMVMELLGKLTGLEGQAAVAVVDVTERKPVIAACLDFGAKLSDFVEFMTRVKDDPAGDKPPLSTRVDGGHTYWLIGNPDHPEAVATPVGTALILSTELDWVTHTANSGLATVEGSLAASPAFQRVRAGTGGSSLAVSAYVNVPEVLAKAKLKDRARKMIDALGLGGVEALGYGMAFTGDGMLDSLVLDAPATDRGLLTIFPTRPTDLSALSWAPSTAFYFAEQSFEFSTVVAKVRDIVGRVDSGMAEEMEKGLAKAHEMLGVDVEKDLLAGLSSDVAAWLALPETGGVYPELGLSFRVKDPAAYEKLIEKTADALCQEIGRHEKVMASRRVLEWHGKRLHVIDLSGVSRHAMVPFTPTICFTGDRMLVTAVPHAMKEILLRQETEGMGSGGLAAQEDVKSLLAAGPKGASSFGYLDLQAILAILYDTGVPLLQTVAKPNVLGGVPIRLDWAQLPAARSMRPYFRSLGAFCVSDGKSLRVSIHSPVGVLMPLAAVGLVAMTMVRGHHRSIEVERATAEVAVPANVTAEAQRKADLLRDAVLAYHAATGKLPEGLQDLTGKNPRTDAPYASEIPLDPWGFGFVYTVTSSAKAEFEVRSWGVDGLPKTEDDVVASGAGK